jgi:hypothetical protein
MLTNEQYLEQVKNIKRSKIHCDICDKEIAIFTQYVDTSFNYENIIEGRIKIICLSYGIFHFCCQDHMTQWINIHEKDIDEDAKKSIPEDAYADNQEKERHESYDSAEDVSPQDIDILKDAEDMH